MSTKKILDDVLSIFSEINDIVDNINWRDYSETRVRILLTNKMDDLKHIVSEIPDDDLYSSEDASIFFENVLDKIARILNSMPKDKMIFQFYELELWRLRYASMYALQWGHGGELQVAGTAHALANVLIGIQTMDVQNLLVDWDHPEFEKRRKLILNYLNSAYMFFFSLCTSLNLIYKHDIETWMFEGLKGSEQYLKYLDHFWNVPKSIQLEKKKFKNVRDPNYSPYYATFAGIDYIITFLLDLQKYFFNDHVKINIENNLVNLSDQERFLDSLMIILEKGEYYIEDFKKHVEEGYFDLNEDPLNDSDIKETIYELEVTRKWIKGLYSLYRLIIKDMNSEIEEIEKEVIPTVFGYIDKYNHLFSEPDFVKSQMADAINANLIEAIMFSGIFALKTQNLEYVEKIKRDYSFFFTIEGIQRYPTLNGLFTTLLITLDLKNKEYSSLEKYAETMIEISNHTIYEPRNTFSYFLLGNMILLLLNKKSKEDFLKIIKDKFENLLPYFSQSLISEIEIYLSDLSSALKGEPASFDMKRLLTSQYYDPYSLIVPEIGQLAEQNQIGEIVYLPFNLQNDFLVDIEAKMLDQIETVSEIIETIGDQTDTISD